MIIIPRLKLGYQNIPKVATTSMVHWLYDCCEGGGERPRDLVGVADWKRRYFLSGRFGPFSIENRQECSTQYEDHYRFAIVRDPIQRFLSMYRNRIVYHRELSEQSGSAQALREAGLPFDPDINGMIARLEGYFACSSSIAHHAQPMLPVLGPDLTAYTRIADISEIDSVLADIRSFWGAAGVVPEAKGMESDTLGVEQASGARHIDLHSLEPASFERLLEYYRDDYACIPTVDVDRVKQQYAEARRKSVQP